MCTKDVVKIQTNRPCRAQICAAALGAAAQI